MTHRGFGDDAARAAAVRGLHDGPLLVVLAVTGGGVAVIEDLLLVPGASRTVLEVTVPYAETALVELLGERPDQAVSTGTAEAMAAACLARASELAGDVPDDAVLAGVACTAALATDRPKRGDHRAHVAVATDRGVVSRDVVFDKGALDRAGEDRVVADVVLELMVEVAER